MSATPDFSIDEALHDACEALIREHGPQTLEWLVRRARRLRRDARIDDHAVFKVIEVSTLLVPRPGGAVDHLSRVFDGAVLTHRARAPLAGRTDLWAGLSLQPWLNLAALAPIPLAAGGEVRRAPSGEDVLVGPPGWLPAVDRFELVGLRLQGGVLSTETVEVDRLPDLAAQQAARAIIADHYRRERWWRGVDELESRPGELVRALTLARLEDPDLLTVPYPPLNELLYNALEQQEDDHHWRDFSAVRQEESVSFSLTGMPVALDMELRARARLYGMSHDQFVIALLGHLAWRTPFAEDCEPFAPFWDPKASVTPPTRLRVIGTDPV